MAWGGGGFGPPMGGGGRPGAPVGTLPFAGIPSELQAGVDQLLAEEPDHGEPTVRFSQLQTEPERRRLTLWRLLTEHPSMLAGAAVLVVVIALVTQVGPKLTEYAITHGMAPGHHDMAVVALHGRPLRGGGGRHGPEPALAGEDHRPPGGGRHGRPADQGVHPHPAHVTGLLHRREVRRHHDPDDERHREPPTAPPGRPVQFAIQGLTMVVITVILFTTNARLAFITVVWSSRPHRHVLVVPLCLRARATTRCATASPM